MDTEMISIGKRVYRGYGRICYTQVPEAHEKSLCYDYVGVQSGMHLQLRLIELKDLQVM
jgi:hypothetical protein